MERPYSIWYSIRIAFSLTYGVRQGAGCPALCPGAHAPLSNGETRCESLSTSVEQFEYRRVVRKRSRGHNTLAHTSDKIQQLQELQEGLCPRGNHECRSHSTQGPLSGPKTHRVYGVHSESPKTQQNRYRSSRLVLTRQKCGR